jgi:hypothetical protein
MKEETLVHLGEAEAWLELQKKETPVLRSGAEQ